MHATNPWKIDEGEKGIIVGYAESHAAHRQTLLAMGLTPGTEFRLIRSAPLGDPIEIEVRGTTLTLRKAEMAHLLVEKLEAGRRDVTVALVGNPNCGKTTVFNALTGARQRVGNWAGVTVERKVGRYRFAGKNVEVVDLPGIYSLNVYQEESALDERIARNYILTGKADLIVNVVDTTNLERNLYLTAQLTEMGVPVLVLLNIFADEEDAATIDSERLTRALGCPAVPLNPLQRPDVEKAKEAIDRFTHEKPIPKSPLDYGEDVERLIGEVESQVAERANAHGIDERWLAIQIVEKNQLGLTGADSALADRFAEKIAALEQAHGESSDIVLADGRYQFVHEAARNARATPVRSASRISESIDRLVLNRVLGIPLFLGLMYPMFLFTIKLGRTFRGFFNLAAETLFVDGPAAALSRLGMPDWLIFAMTEGIGNGLREVAAFIPIIAFLYLFISVLEESGYMARAAFVMDRFMRAIGLPGKAFVPMILGFGCNVPAVMATRTLEKSRDRIVTALITPFMSCGARLPVYAIFAAVFFPVDGHRVIFTLYLIGIAFAVFTALVLKHTLLRETEALSVMELPKYRLPRPSNVLLNTWNRIKGFVFKAGKIIVPMVLLINLLGAWGTDGSFRRTNTDRSVLAAVGRTLTPALAPMGIDRENWPATVALVTGLLHKVVVIGTLEAIYVGTTANDGEKAPSFDLRAGLQRAVASIPANFAQQFNLKDESLPAHGEKPRFQQEMTARFDGAAGAFAYLLFVLLYFPCIATTAAITREAGWRWALFLVGWTTGLAYLTASTFYQIATFAAHRAATVAWSVAAAALFIIALGAMRYLAKGKET